MLAAAFDRFRFLSLAVSFSLMLPSMLNATAVPSEAAAKAPDSAKSSAQKKPSAFKFIKEETKSGLKEYRLSSNGMKVLLQEKHDAPLVTVMVVYKVGSRNEAVGYTGSTHFLEHMMFKGTQKHDPLKGTGLDDLLKPMGGMNNATTSYDRTNYFEIVPAKDLGVVLEVEADRMRNALLRKNDRESEMTVVRNELERGENSAEEVLSINLFATAFREHPYHHPVIGWRSDVEGVPLARLRQFYSDFYYPNNATLIVIGDFQSQEALDLIAANFGKLPASPKPFPPVYTVEPPQQGERRFKIEHGDEMPKIMMGYRIPNALHKDTYALEVLAALLGDQSRQSSRLYKKLVDKGLASQTYAGNYTMKDPGLFIVYASASSGTKLEKIEKVIEEELSELASKTVPEAELERAKKSVWKRMRLGSDDPMAFAQQLADAEAVADWNWWFDFEKKIKDVKAEDIRRVAKNYFQETNRNVGYHLPKTKVASDAKEAKTSPDASENSSSAEQIEFLEAQVKKAGMPKARLVSDTTPGAGGGGRKSSIASKTSHKLLGNGLSVYVMPVPGSGIVAVSGKLKGGESCASAEKTLVPELLGSMLNKGSRSMSKEALADILETMGTRIDPYVSTFWTDFSAKVVSEDLDQFMSLLSDCIISPAFKEEELDKLKKQKEAEIKDYMVETDELANNKLYGSLYKPDCVFYARPFEEQIAELEKIKVSDLKDLHKSNYISNNFVLALVGDIKPEQGFALAEKYFGKWEKGTAYLPADLKTCRCDESLQGKKIVSRLPEKSSVSIVMGYPADTSIKRPDFCASQIANSALGHDTISSRLAELREKHGLTYGIHSSFADTSESMAPWELELTVNPDNTDKALKIVRQILNDYYAKGITPKELAMEKQRLAGEFVVNRMRTPRQLAEALTKYGVLGLGPEFMDNYPSMLAKVTLSQANAAIKKYMNPAKLVSSMAGSIPEAAVERK